jgi:nucleotide-binding universal stress UspA family protein
MPATSIQPSAAPLWVESLFDRVVCGVDGTEGSFAAVRQAGRLLPARRTLELVAVVEEPRSDWSTPARAAELARNREEAQLALRDGHGLYPHAHSHVRLGDPGHSLCEAAWESQATLLVVGAPTAGRLGGLVLGSVGTYVLHSSPASALIARESRDDGRFPQSIVVGHDGSESADAALAVAAQLAHRFDASLRVLAATGGDGVDAHRLAAADVEWTGKRPVDALVAASEEADLVVVGSRGLRGLRALGSVSERLGHAARCSVLVVRPPAAELLDVVDDEVRELE